MRAIYGKARLRKKNRIFKAAKGYWGARHRLWRTVKDAVRRGRQMAFFGRKQCKRDYRALWITRLSAALRSRGMNYSTFIGKLHKSGVVLDRKSLSELAIIDPKAFDRVFAVVKAC